ncbi:MAG: ATP-binding protein [Deltaproteobacteria bacterium]|nr:ATP-binding protein [Deltaproteobacteria bacterium]
MPSFGSETRYLFPFIIEDLQEKMVFLGGPRQVGKTTLAETLLHNIPGQYYNWDKLGQRNAALKGQWAPKSNLIVLDEFHKYKKWKTWLKGEYDTLKGRFKFLLTGSARLDLYRRGGDSLQGRYHSYRLHPFSLAEIHALKLQTNPFQPLQFRSGHWISDFKMLLRYGGFPEPFVKQNDRHWRRWQQEKIERLLKEDIRDLTVIQDVGNLALLADLLPSKIASILSINSLAEDLGVNFRTVAHWFDVFEQFYYCFRIPPYQTRKVAAVKKEKKLYLWDWSSIKNEGAKLENMVASHLLKFCHYLVDVEGYKAELHFLRDSTGKELDFLITIDRQPWFAVEVKNHDTQIASSLYYFKKRLNIPQVYQVTTDENQDYEKKGIRVMPASQFLTGLV